MPLPCSRLVRVVPYWSSPGVSALWLPALGEPPGWLWGCMGSPAVCHPSIPRTCQLPWVYLGVPAGTPGACPLHSRGTVRKAKGFALRCLCNRPLLLICMLGAALVWSFSIWGSFYLIKKKIACKPPQVRVAGDGLSGLALVSPVACHPHGGCPGQAPWALPCLLLCIPRLHPRGHWCSADSREGVPPLKCLRVSNFLSKSLPFLMRWGHGSCPCRWGLLRA